MACPQEIQRRIEKPLAEFLGYWHRLRGNEELPLRADFQPGGIPALLPFLTVAEPFGERFRVRLIGTEVHARIVRPVRPLMMLDELESGSYLAFLTRVYRTVMEKRLPVVSRTQYDGAHGQVSISRLTVPFAHATIEPWHLFSILAFSHKRNQQDAIETLGEAEVVHAMHVVSGGTLHSKRGCTSPGVAPPSTRCGCREARGRCLPRRRPV